MTNSNRVLVIPLLRMEDQGEYVCRINNDYSIKEASITLFIQGEFYRTSNLMVTYSINSIDNLYLCS